MPLHVPGSSRIRGSHSRTARRSHSHSGYLAPMEYSNLPLDQQVVDSVVGPGDIPPGTVDGGALSDFTLTAQKFAETLSVPRIEATLPTLPDADYPEGTIVFLTTDGKLYRNLADVWTKDVEGDDVVSLSADKITAGTLAAAVLLSGFISTASTGTRVEFDSYGIRAYNGTTLIANIPTDGVSNVYFKAVIEALGLTVTGDAELRGSGNKFAASSVTSLESAVANPTVEPSISGGIQTKSVAFSGRGLAYDTAGGAGGATTVWWTAAGGPIHAGTPILYELLDSNGNTNRSENISAEFSSGYVYGVAVLGSYVYVLGKSGSTWRVARYTKSDLTLAPTLYDAVSFPIATPVSPTITSDGTNLYIADVASATRYLSWNVYDGSMVKQGSTVNTGVAPWGPVYTPGGMYVGSGDFGATRVLIVGWNGSPTSVFAFDSTGTRQSSDEWTRDGGDAGGIAYDGTYFYISKEVALVFNRYSGITTTGAWWFKYTWYDSAGTTHETATSPSWSIYLSNARRFFDITTPVEPGGGGADEPDGRRIYAVPSATEPATSSYKLQATTADETYTMGAYASGGAAPPTSNDFPGGTPAQLKSADTGWTLKGSGAINRTGTAFPSGPATNDTFFRSDLGMEFYYDGTRWLSTQLFTAGPSNAETSSGTYYIVLSDTQSTFMRLALLPVPGSDIYVEKLLFTAYVNSGGSALSASHKWAVEFEKVSVANIGTSLGTATIDSGNSSNWRLWELAVNDVLGGGYSTYPHIRLSATKTGTPGSLNITGGTTMTYRVVAT